MAVTTPDRQVAKSMQMVMWATQLLEETEKRRATVNDVYIGAYTEAQGILCALIEGFGRVGTHTDLDEAVADRRRFHSRFARIIDIGRKTAKSAHTKDLDWILDQVALLCCGCTPRYDGCPFNHSLCTGGVCECCTTR